MRDCVTSDMSFSREVSEDRESQKAVVDIRHMSSRQLIARACLRINGREITTAYIIYIILNITFRYFNKKQHEKNSKCSV